MARTPAATEGRDHDKDGVIPPVQRMPYIAQKPLEATEFFADRLAALFYPFMRLKAVHYRYSKIVTTLSRKSLDVHCFVIQYSEIFLNHSKP